MIPAAVPPHYRCVSLRTPHDDTHAEGYLQSYEDAYTLIEAERLYPEWHSQGDPRPPVPLLRAHTDRFGFPPQDQSKRTAALVAEERKRVPRSKLSGKSESRVLLWCSDTRRTTEVAAAYLIRHWNVSFLSALAMVQHYWPLACSAHGLGTLGLRSLELWTEKHSRGTRICVECALSDGRSDVAMYNGGALLATDPKAAADLGCIDEAADTLPCAALALSSDASPTQLATILSRLVRDDWIASLVHLDLSHRPVDMHAPIIAAFLRASSSIRILTLFSCELHDHGAALILNALVIPNHPFEEDQSAECAQYNQSLQELSIGRNSLGPSSLAQLTAIAKHNNTLATLRLGSLTSIADELASFLLALSSGRSGMRHLDLDYTHLPLKTQKALLVALPLLRSVSIARTALSFDCLPSEPLPWLEHINLSGNRLQGNAIAVWVCGATALNSLAVSACNLSHIHLPPSLATLDMSHNNIGLTAAAFSSQLSTSRISSLTLTSCHLGTAGAILVMLNVPCTIDTLLLGENNVHDSCASTLCSLVSRAMSLRLLDLSHNALSKEALQPVMVALEVTSASTELTRLVELTIDTSGNPCGSNVFGLPCLARSKRTVAYAS